MLFAHLKRILRLELDSGLARGDRDHRATVITTWYVPSITVEYMLAYQSANAVVFPQPSIGPGSGLTELPPKPVQR